VERQPLVEGDCLQAVFDHRPHPDQPDAVRSVKNCDLLRSRVQITSDEYHDHGLLVLRAVALGLSEGSSSAPPFS
jgi:hypothetical protein